MMAFVVKSIRSLFFTLDKVIYGLIADVYSLLMVITRTTIFSNADIAEFSSRIYAIAGIFMLFKISLSVINYIVNPDSFTDKEKGMSSIGKRIVISLVMLVLVPYIFQEAYQLQSIILEENTILTLVFGSAMKNGLPNESYVSNAGKNMQFTLMYTFMQPNVSEMSYHKDYPLEVCSETYVWDNGKIKNRADSNTIFELNPLCFGTYKNDSYSGGVLSNAFSDSDVKLNDVYQNYAIGIATQNFDVMMRQDLVLAKYDDIYLIDYKLGVSTAVGVVVVYILLLFCIDIAARSVKLGFLQMIAPIPILSYIDPKSGKDGMLTKWRKTCVSTYLSLFLRLFALYMGIYAITIIGSYTDVISGEKIQGNWLLDVFMMIGILIFAKSLPKIIEEISGAKASGKFNINIFKKIEDEALLGKNATGLVAGAVTGTLGAVSGAGFGRGLSGAFGGLVHGKGWSGTLKDQRNINSTLRTARIDGSTFGGRLHASVTNMLGTGGETYHIQKLKDQIDHQNKELDNSIKHIEDDIAPNKKKIASMKKFADSISSMEKRAKEEIEKGNGGSIGRNYLTLKAQFERLKATGASASAIAGAEAAMNKYLNDTGMKAYLTQGMSGNFDDGSDDKTLQNMTKTAEQSGANIKEILNKAGITKLDFSDGGFVHTYFGTTKGLIGDAERAIFDQEQEIEALKVKKADLGDQAREIEKREAVAKANQQAVKRG